MKTIRLFDQDAYVKEFTAKVTSCVSEKGIFKVTLNQTAFYPEGGGQPADTGRLNQIQVSDVQEKDGEIWHTVSAPIEPETTVSGKIDWERRYYYMQNHSGEHIVSGIVNRRFGYHNVGFHMNQEVVTIDFDGMLQEEQLKEIEQEANRAIEENVPVRASYPSRTALENTPYRSKKEIEGQVRLVTVEGYDCCACCGSHVRNTGEIRVIKLLTAQKYKSGVRLTMLSGNAACEDYSRKHEELLQVSRRLSVKPKQTVEAVERLLEDNKMIHQELTAWKRKVYELQAQMIPEGTKKICFADPSLNGADLREFANAAAVRAELVLILGANGSYVLRSNHRDVREVCQKFRENFSAKGGGSSEMVQGTLQGETDDIKKYFQTV